MTIVLSIAVIISSLFFMGIRIADKDNIVKLHTERYDKNSVVIDIETIISQGNDFPGVLIKENSNNIVIGFIKCAYFFQRCLVDAPHESGKIIIKNNDKPIFVRYHLSSREGEINRLEQIWP